MARHPATQPIAITARTMNRCLTEKSMILEITINLPGGGWLWGRGCSCVCRVGSLASVRMKIVIDRIKGFPAIRIFIVFFAVRRGSAAA